jgi:hypothetical protein
MSEIRVNNIKNEAGTGAPTFPNGATVLGTLTGTATTATYAGTAGIATYAGTAGIATVAQGLTGSPSITVSGVTNTGATSSSSLTVTNDATVGGALTVTGNLTVNGTQTIINTTNLEITDPLVGIGSGNTTDAQANGDGIQIYGTTNKTFTYNDTKKAFEANIPIATNENRFITGAEKTVLVSGNTATLTYNSSSANVAICTNATGNITLSVVGIPTSSDFDNHAVTFTVIATSTSGVARTCTAVNMNGVSKTIKWAGGSLANAVSGLTTTAGYTIYGFTGINTVGSASTTDNYEVFGVASGGFF